MCRVILTTPLQGLFLIRLMELDIAYLCTKFDKSFSYSRDMVGAHQNLNSSSHVTTPLSGMLFHPWTDTCYDQPVYQI